MKDEIQVMAGSRSDGQSIRGRSHPESNIAEAV
jgi:hypothetical protein